MLLSLAAEGLGTSDATNQLKSLELLRLRLEKAEADAAAEVAKTGKFGKHGLGLRGSAGIATTLNQDSPE